MSPRDPNLDHPAVKTYRDICHLTPNHFQRQEIVTTIKWGAEVLGNNEKSALAHWEGTLRKFMLEGCNPKRVDWAMDRYETRIRGEKR
jgi:hypothetical protein